MIQIIKDKNLYLVGGFVRDEILGTKSIDIDYTYQGDAIDFAEKSGFNIIKTNKTFRTVRIKIGSQEIDIASTREENYPQKGHLPHVFNIGCSIEEDLKRRDFTVNAIAKRTSDNKIIDVYDGLNDIKNKKLKILHKKSFIDDPTRIIRGLKFSVRLGFELDDKTHQLQEDYLNNINYDMSYHRLKNELKDAFNINRHEVFDKFIEQNMYKLLGTEQFTPKIDSKKIEEAIIKNTCENPWIIYMSFFDLSKFELTRQEKKFINMNDDTIEGRLIRELKNVY